jgi:hypothetical protein
MMLSAHGRSRPAFSDVDNQHSLCSVGFEEVDRGLLSGETYLPGRTSSGSRASDGGAWRG